ncbi:MAG: DUF72 domain-containing protein [Candidatus Omnitrophica bacterium]|nr:DUF72 domain-containing protein [Candidatus Omnitrophota bacterium]
MSRIFIGTSGWNYAHWRKVFYPDGLGQNKWLAHYVNFFNSVELNVTFYRLVQKKTFQNWNKTTPGGFNFAVKGSRFITHIKRLKDSGESLKLFLDNAKGLKEKLAAVLWQLPPGFKKDLKRLESFLKLLKKAGVRQAFEFRNASWFDKEVYETLKGNNACLCMAHSGRFPCVKEITADFVYLRFHGGASLYGSNYSDKELKEWACFAKGLSNKDVFAFFNNDAYGYAVKNALRFKELLVS